MRVGVDLGGTKVEAVLLDDGGRERARERLPTPRGGESDVVAAVACLVRAVEGGRYGHPPVGVGVAAAVDARGAIVKAPNLPLEAGLGFLDALTLALERPVRLGNDANCFALSEATDGAGAGAEVVFGVILGTGVGGGVVVRGRVVNGVNGIAGEWGHIPLPRIEPEDDPDAPCGCGRRGCLEAYLSGPALLRDYKARGGRAENAAAVAIAARAGDALAEDCLRRYEHRLARGLAVVIDILDPDVIVFGGGLSRMTRLYERVPALLPRHTFSDEVRTRLVPALHGSESGVRGAAWLATA